MSGNLIAILQGSIIENTADKDASEYSKGFSGMASAWQLFGLVILLVVILVAAYYTSKFVGGYKLGQMKNSNFKVIDTYRISQNKALQIIKAGNKYILISIGKDTVDFITELEESDIFIRDTSMKEKQSFSQILEKLKNMNK